MRKMIKENKVGWPMSDSITPEQYYINQLLDKLDAAACDVESRWGPGRLDRLVSFDMANKWKAQMDKLNQAILDNDVVAMLDLVNGTIRGYGAMEADAIAQGNQPNDTTIAWTVEMPSGRTLAVIKHANDMAALHRLRQDIPGAVIWTLDEIAKIIDREYSLVTKIDQRAVYEPTEAIPFDDAKGDGLPDEFR